MPLRAGRRCSPARNANRDFPAAGSEKSAARNTGDEGFQTWRLGHGRTLAGATGAAHRLANQGKVQSARLIARTVPRKPLDPTPASEAATVVSRPLRNTLLMACLLAACASSLARGPWRASDQNTSGWDLMSPEERIEHQARIRGFKSYDECQAYRREHHQAMEERARREGRQLGAGRRDFCSHLSPAVPQR